MQRSASASVLFCLFGLGFAGGQSELAAQRADAGPRAQRRVEATANPSSAPGRAEERSRHRIHSGGVVRGPEVESDRSDELVQQPEIQNSGDESGTRRLPKFLLGNPYRLAYVGGEYTPREGERLDPLLREEWQRRRHGTTYGFVMFQGRITTRKRDAVERSGVVLGTHHTFNCMTAKIPFASLPRLAVLREVRWVGYARPVQKTDPALLPLMVDPVAREKPISLFVTVYDSDPHARVEHIVQDAARIAGTRDEGQFPWLPTHRVLPNGRFHDELEGLGAKVTDYFAGMKLLVVEAKPALVEKIVALDFVHFVERNPALELHHDQSTRQIHIDSVRSILTNDGSDTVVGMMDTGVDRKHVDFKAKHWIGWSFNGQDPYTDPVGHGSHLMGTMSALGVADDKYRGCAPLLGSRPDRRVFLATILGGRNGSAQNAIDCLERRFAGPVTIGRDTTPRPSVTNNSWGVAIGTRPRLGYVGTDALCIAFDRAAFFRQQQHVCSSGNNGGTWSRQFSSNQLQPAVSKLALTVANAHSRIETPGVPGQPHPSSSKGPTGDARLSPHILAPGQEIDSVLANSVDKYKAGSGTSMAAAHVTGTIAGLHEHYATTRNSPALTRAVIAATSNPYKDTRNWTVSSDSYYCRQGHGMVDAYKAHYQRDVPGGYTVGHWAGTFDSRSAGASLKIAVPADATRTYFVLTFDEKPASPGAKRACVHDLDLWLDAEPFGIAFNSGEWSSRRAWDTWEFYGHTSTINQVRGRRLKIKIHPRVRPSGKDVVRWGLAYVIYRGDTTPPSTLSTQLSDTYVRPNSTVTLTADVNVATHMLTNAYLKATTSNGYLLSSLKFRDRGNLERSYLLPPSSWTMGLIGTWFAPVHRRLTWRLKALPFEGRRDVCVELRADNRAGSVKKCKSTCIDGQRPPDIQGLRPSHVPGQWSNDPVLKLRWDPITDVGCAGISGFATIVETSPKTPTVETIKAPATAHTVQLKTSKDGKYFSIRARDRAGNLSANTKSTGPFFIDTVKPSIRAVLVQSGAHATKSKLVSVWTVANDSHSGVESMRFSGDKVHWSVWEPYVQTKTNYDLTAHGGGTNNGTKTVYIKVRDKAGNISEIGQDSIVYDTLAPVVTLVRINGGAAATDSLNAQVQVSALGDVWKMRLSSDASTWSPWVDYKATPFAYDLSSNGGTSKFGQKTVYAQLRDIAGNLSTVKKDTILFYPKPKISGLAPSAATQVHNTVHTLTGTGFGDIVRVRVGSHVISSQTEDFKGGWFELKSATEIRVWLPQPIEVGTHKVTVENPAYASNESRIVVSLNATPLLVTTPSSKGGGGIDIFVARGNLPANAFGLMTMSASQLPLVITSVVTLEHGGNTVTGVDPTFTLLPSFVFNPKGVAHTTFSLPPVVPPVPLYFEAILFDPGNLLKLPMLTSNADRTALK